MNSLYKQTPLFTLEDDIRKILSEKKPMYVNSLWKVLGVVSYYRKFIPNFLIIAHPLHYLTRKDIPELSLHISPTNVMWKDIKYVRSNGYYNEDCMIHTSQQS